MRTVRTRSYSCTNLGYCVCKVHAWIGYAIWPGVEFYLHGERIPNDGSGLVNVTDIGSVKLNSDALICRSELIPDNEFGGWYLDPDGQTPNVDSDNRIGADNTRGWRRERVTDSDGHRVVRLEKVSSTATEGRFTCSIPHDRDNPRALRVLYPSELLSQRRGTVYHPSATSNGSSRSPLIRVIHLELVSSLYIQICN